MPPCTGPRLLGSHAGYSGEPQTPGMRGALPPGPHACPQWWWVWNNWRPWSTGTCSKNKGGRLGEQAMKSPFSIHGESSVSVPSPIWGHAPKEQSVMHLSVATKPPVPHLLIDDLTSLSEQTPRYNLEVILGARISLKNIHRLGTSSLTFLKLKYSREIGKRIKD